MKTLLCGIAVLALAGCATGQTATKWTWIQQPDGAWCYSVDAITCANYHGPEPQVNTTERWWKFTGDVLDTANQGQQSFGRGVYTGK